MSKLQNARMYMLDQHVQELALLLQRTQWQARALADLFYSGGNTTETVVKVENITCGICQMQYSRHPKIEGVHVLCSGKFVTL